jgi:hypothetical protein
LSEGYKIKEYSTKGIKNKSVLEVRYIDNNTTLWIEFNPKKDKEMLILSIRKFLKLNDFYRYFRNR